jgi:hypothetical protein
MHYGIGSKKCNRTIKIARAEGVMETADGGLVTFG